MSFEGYFQQICKNGHYHVYDAYDNEEEKCPDCGSEWAWSNMVDTTNGTHNEFGGRIDNYKEPILIKEAVYKKCDHCGSHIKLLEERVYAPPNY